MGVAKKFGAISANVAEKKIILIDDSIVRGNTIGPIIKLLKDAGAKEVYVYFYLFPDIIHMYTLLLLKVTTTIKNKLFNRNKHKKEKILL